MTSRHHTARTSRRRDCSFDRSTPDFAAIQRELATKGVTRMLLWQEYKAQHPGGCQYSAFCHDYEAWLGRQDAVMRFEHVPGEKLFVDYAGKTMAVVDRHTSEVKLAEVFVAALGASHYTYVEATLTQTVADWLAAHVRALEYRAEVAASVRVEINAASAPAIMASEKSRLFIVCISVQGSDVWPLGALGHSCQSVVQRRSLLAPVCSSTSRATNINFYGPQP